MNNFKNRLKRLEDLQIGDVEIPENYQNLSNQQKIDLLYKLTNKNIFNIDFSSLTDEEKIVLLEKLKNINNQNERKI